MGTWSAAILGNDTSAQTHERFFTLFDEGKSVASIVKTIERERRARVRAIHDDGIDRDAYAAVSLQPGTCFYVLDEGRAYNFWVVSASRAKGWGDVGVAWLDTGTAKTPVDMAECERAFVRGVRKNAPGDPRGTWRAQQALIGYDGPKGERELTNAIAAHCTIVGRTPRLSTKRVFVDSSGSSLDLADGKNLVRRLVALANEAKARRFAKSERLGAWLAAAAQAE